MPPCLAPFRKNEWLFHFFKVIPGACLKKKEHKSGEGISLKTWVVDWSIEVTSIINEQVTLNTSIIEFGNVKQSKYLPSNTENNLIN